MLLWLWSQGKHLAPLGAGVLLLMGLWVDKTTQVTVITRGHILQAILRALREPQGRKPVTGKIAMPLPFLSTMGPSWAIVQPRAFPFVW